MYNAEEIEMIQEEHDLEMKKMQAYIENLQKENNQLIKAAMKHKEYVKTCKCLFRGNFYSKRKFLIKMITLLKKKLNRSYF